MERQHFSHRQQVHYICVCTNILCRVLSSMLPLRRHSSHGRGVATFCNYHYGCKKQTKQSHYRPGQALRVPGGEAPKFQDNRHVNVVRSSALRTGHFYSPGNIPGTHFCWMLSQPQGQSAAGRIMSMKNSIHTIRNRTPYLLACSAVPKPTVPLCTAWL